MTRPFAASGNCAADVMAISQKLHTKLVQKLILTPSLQQAIKLLPMSTLELSELLNQEMVENPMLEESPTEDLQQAEAAAGEAGREAGAGEDRHLGRPGLRVLLRRLPRRRLPAAHAHRGQGAAADREHALDVGVAVRPSAVAAVDADRASRRRARLARPSSATWTTTGTWWRRWRNWRRWGRGRSRTSSGALALVQGFDPDWRGGARPAGVPAAAAAASRPGRHAGRSAIVTEHMRLLQNHQIPELAKKVGMSIEELKQHIEHHPGASIRSRAAATTRRSRST